MKITHYSNSFIQVEAAGKTLVCDPWVGAANHGGWHAFPEFRREDLRACVANADAVYLSHLHSDHFDPPFLQDSGLLAKPFFIKRFAGGVMARRLRGLGVQQVHELEAFEVAAIGSLQLAIVPQLTSNSAGLDDDVNYDLDTSLVVSDGRHTFFNQVDNPLSLDDLARVKAFISGRFGAIDIACLMAGAAGEYPQCFIGIDREAEKDRLVAGALVKLQQQLQVLQPRYLFPAGGTYFIPGKFHALNAFIAQPSHAQYAQAAATLAQTLVLEGGLQVELQADAAPRVTQRVPPLHADRADAVARHAADLYAHEAEPPPVCSDQALLDLLHTAELNYRNELEKRQVPQACHISFQVHEGLRCDKALALQSAPSLAFDLAPAQPAAEPRRLAIHIDRTALQRCLQRKSNWNQTLSGSLCLFERQPNLYDPNTLFALNFFAA
jgi:L-ascorbate metabolism protein UlaG (beta-lactamase superfamily)